MEKEKVTEELVRQNGNQAAAVMADYAGQGGGGGGSISGVSVSEPVSAPVFRDATDEDLAKFSKSDNIIIVAEINGVVPLTIVDASVTTNVLVKHLYGIGYMDGSQSTAPLKALYRVSGPNISRSSVTSSMYVISDDGSLLGKEGLS